MPEPLLFICFFLHSTFLEERGNQGSRLPGPKGQGRQRVPRPAQELHLSGSRALGFLGLRVEGLGFRALGLRS